MSDPTACCRNCDSVDVFKSPSGILAPFFMWRVCGIRTCSSSTRECFEHLINIVAAKNQQTMMYSFVNFLLKAQKKLLRQFPSGRKLLQSRIDTSTNLEASTDLRVCNICGFIGPDFEYKTLDNLYTDYRSESYNNERELYEPSYKTIVDLVGKSDLEIKSRLNNADSLLTKYVDIGSIKTVVDYGGGDGRYIPEKLVKKDVYIVDISSENPVNLEHKRINKLENGLFFEYMQLCHILEHTMNPLEFLVEVTKNLKSGGYLYIEVPQDRSDDDIKKLQTKSPDTRHYIHEHINLYTPESVAALAESAGLKKLTVEKKLIEVGWTKALFISGLFVKP